MISETIIEQVRLNTDITDLIGSFVKLRRRGRNSIGLCPFHQEKTPSFSVSSEKQIFHCFGCGKGGNVYSFLMEHERMSFPESVRFLAAKAGIAIPEERSDPGRKEEIENLFYAHEIANSFFRENLRSTRHKSLLNDYLIKERGLTEEIIEKFNLGVAPTGWRGLVEFAKSKNITPQILAKAGLAGYAENKREYYDRFRDRLMIPIFNLSDRVIAFGGRALGDETGAKYINSPETALYSKGRLLYGLNINRNDIREQGHAIVVEGYFDLISLWKVGVRNVVASSGTAFTPEQGRLLARFANNAYLFFDADSAGIKAAIRSVDSLYNAGVDVKVVKAPPGADPDTVAQQGAKSVRELLKSSRSYLRFRVGEFQSQARDLVETKTLIADLRELSSKIIDSSLRELFRRESADLLGVDVSQLSSGAPKAEPARSSSLSDDDWGERNMKTIEAELVSFLLSHSSMTGRAAETISAEHIQSKQLRNLYGEILSSYEKTGGQKAAEFIGHIKDDEIRKTASFLAHREWITDTPGDTLDDYLNKMLEIRVEKPTIKKLKERLKEAERKGDNKAAGKLATEIYERLKAAEGAESTTG